MCLCFVQLKCEANFLLAFLGADQIYSCRNLVMFWFLNIWMTWQIVGGAKTGWVVVLIREIIKPFGRWDWSGNFIFRYLGQAANASSNNPECCVGSIRQIKTLPSWTILREPRAGLRIHLKIIWLAVALSRPGNGWRNFINAKWTQKNTARIIEDNFCRRNIDGL